jgi:hypothetical protein
MTLNSELVVSLPEQTTNGTSGIGEKFNICYVCCCAWIQYGNPITLEDVKKLEDTEEWNNRDTDLYRSAVESLGVPEGKWVEQSFQLPASKLKGIYNLYLPGKLGVALAVQRVKISPTFPPRKNLERCECYIFDPNKGIYRINMRGADKFNETARQEVVSLATEALAPHNRALCKDICWADITRHVYFTIGVPIEALDSKKAML